MSFPKNVIGFGVLAAAASANAGVLGLTATEDWVFDSGHKYMVWDVFIDCSLPFDKVVNFFGQSTSPTLVRTIKNGVANAGDAATATNGAPFAHSNGSGWMPSHAANANAWDSFVTMGARSQSEAISFQAIGPDVYFVNNGTPGAQTIQGGSNATPAYVGAGWQANLPNDPRGLAGFNADKRLMLGRFSVDITNFLPTDSLALQFKGKVTMKVNGTVAGGGTTFQPAFDRTFGALIPAPGVAGLLGLASLLTRRRK